MQPAVLPAWVAPPRDVLAGAPPAGLDEAEAERRLAEFGFNDPVAPAHTSPVRQLLERFSNPLVLILLLASVVSGILGDIANAAIVFGIVVLSVAVESLQMRRANRSAESLAARVAHTAAVLRSGEWRTLPRRLVVPGDVIRLDAGDLVPADATLVEARDLHVNEASLTGESLPVEKESGAGVSMGTAVVSGSGVAAVVRTGARTAFGDIAKALAARPPPSEFERGLVRFGVFVAKTVVFLVLFVFLANAAMHRNALESLLFGIALAVGLTPEFLPMITTVTLSRGAERMASKDVIVKNLAAIQNLGSMDVLCTDKTGTLTTGEMCLEHHVGPFGDPDERPLLYGVVNSYFESGVENAMDAAVLRKGRVDPLDSAVLRHEHPDVSGFSKLDEIPFDFERRRVSVVAGRGTEALLVTKGAPESVLAVCTTYDEGDERRPLDDEARARIIATYDALGVRGYRVLAVATAKPAPKSRYTRADEQELSLAGFLAFADPPRAETEQVLRDLSRAGVRVVMLTGDNDRVARHLADQVGLSGSSVVLGSDVERMTDPALGYAVEHGNLFARVTPAQKSRVLRALRTRGHVVGYLGDGINDAPSLHAADVGVSVSSAADVAKEAADVILLRPGLEPVHDGIVEGRKAFGNVMKYLLMGTSSNFGNVFSMAAASAFLPFLPMLPTQILLNNFLYDAAQLAIPSDNVEAGFVAKPRRWDIKVIRRFMLWIGPVSSVFDLLTFWYLLRQLHAGPALFHTGWFVESLVSQTLVIFVIRTTGSPFSNAPSRALLATTLAVVGAAIALPFTAVAPALGLGALPLQYFAFLFLTVVVYLASVTAIKHLVLREAMS